MDKAAKFLSRKKNAALLSAGILTGQYTSKCGQCDSGHSLQTSKEDLLTILNKYHFVKLQKAHLTKLMR